MLPHARDALCCRRLGAAAPDLADRLGPGARGGLDGARRSLGSPKAAGNSGRGGARRELDRLLDLFELSRGFFRCCCGCCRCRLRSLLSSISSSSVDKERVELFLGGFEGRPRLGGDRRREELRPQRSGQPRDPPREGQDGRGEQQVGREGDARGSEDERRAGDGVRRDKGGEAPGEAKGRLGRREDYQESPQRSDREDDVFRDRLYESRDGEDGERGRGGG